MTFEELETLISTLIADYNTLHAGATNPQFLAELTSAVTAVKTLMANGLVQSALQGAQTDWKNLKAGAEDLFKKL